MQLSLLFAWRYIFSKKSTNAINIISTISVLGIALGTMALVIIMSVFNGFEDLLRDLISKFKPDIQITAIEGKVFVPDSTKVLKIKQLEGVEVVSLTLEEVALFEYEGIQNLARLKGVDDQFVEVIDLDTMLLSGEYKIYDAEKDIHYAVVGVNLEANMGVSPSRADNQPLTIYMPKRNAKDLSPTGFGDSPFKQRNVYPSAIYSVRQVDYDNFVITNLAFVQDMLFYEKNEISAIEIKLKPNTNVASVQNAIQEIMGAEFSIKDRYQQDEAFFKITNLEKWVGYIIFSFTLLLVAFNMIGALWMLVLEKQKDIATLKALGATNGLIRGIFLMEGALLSIFGVGLGCLAGVILCVLQQQYGLVELQGSGAFIISAYPVAMRVWDFLIVIVTVMSIGTLAAWLPALRASRVEGILRNE